MSNSLNCLGLARQMLPPLLGKMGKVLKLSETWGGLAVSDGFKSARISEQLIVEFV